MIKKLESPYYGWIFALLGVIGFSFKPVLIKLGYDSSLGVVETMALRMLFVLPFIVFPVIKSTKLILTPGFIRLATVVAIVSYISAMIFDFLGLQYVNVGTERLVLFTYPIFVVIFSIVVGKYKCTKAVVFSMLLTYFGIVFVFVGDMISASIPTKELYSGVFFIILSAISFAIFVLFGERAVKQIGAMFFSSWCLLLTAIVSLVQFLYFYPFIKLFTYSFHVYKISFLLALLGTVFPFYFMSIGLRSIGAVKSAILNNLGPIISIMLGYFILYEPITLYQMAGFILIVFGMFWLKKVQ